MLKNALTKKNFAIAIILILLNSAWITFLFCIGPSPVGVEYTCIENIMSEFDDPIRAIVFLITYPTGLFFGYILGFIDSWLAVPLSLILQILLVVVLVHFIRTLFHKMKAKFSRTES